jgi:hypothetical protein
MGSEEFVPALLRGADTVMQSSGFRGKDLGEVPQLKHHIEGWRVTILSFPKTSTENRSSRFPIVDGKTSIW